MTPIRAARLRQGDTIGIVSPCTRPYSRDYMEQCAAAIAEKGFTIKEGRNLYSDTYGYAASEAERAEDLMGMFLDDQVKMIFFTGGSVCNEILPLIDFHVIRHHPKIVCSFSDGTTLLNAVYARSGLVTYHGQSPNTFEALTRYNSDQFDRFFTAGDITTFEKNSEWACIHEGEADGVLMGGYAANFALLLGGAFFPYQPENRYILFLEDHEKYRTPSEVSAILSHIEQQPIIRSVTGLLFGHYAKRLPPELLDRLRRFGEKNRIPVLHCDDFGHCENNAILPIGCRAHMDAGKRTLVFVEPVIA